MTKWSATSIVDLKSCVEAELLKGMFNASNFYEEVAWSVKEALERLERLHLNADLLVCGLFLSKFTKNRDLRKSLFLRKYLRKFAGYLNFLGVT